MCMDTFTTKHKGAIAELAIAHDLAQRGYIVALPFGDYSDWDLLVQRDQGFEKVQVKYAEITNGYVPVRNRCHSVLAGRVTNTYLYNDRVDWLAVYEPASRQCYYVAHDELRGEVMALRIDPPKNGQKDGIRWAKDYQSI
jgi:PD-(D/E)XK endonuclease